MSPADRTQDAADVVVEPSRVVEAMASAVDRVRRMATAALFCDPTDETTR